MTEVVLHCSDCDREVVLTSDQQKWGYVSITPLDGWTAPPLRCPACAHTGRSE